MSFIKSILFTVTTLLTINTAYAVTLQVDAAGLKGNDGFDIHIGYCNSSNGITHNVKLTSARHGYQFTTPYPTPQSASTNICIDAKCRAYGGIGCSYDEGVKTTKPVINSPDCVIRLYEEHRDGSDWHFSYTSACG